MPFTQEEFFGVFAAYNTAIWPLPLLTYILGVAAVVLAFWLSRVATALISAILALMWLVNGGAYHWSFFSEINPVARGFGILFIAQALLLLGPLSGLPSELWRDGTPGQWLVSASRPSPHFFIRPWAGWLAMLIRPRHYSGLRPVPQRYSRSASCFSGHGKS